jgi:hypothetical protein
MMPTNTVTAPENWLKELKVGDEVAREERDACEDVAWHFYEIETVSYLDEDVVVAGMGTYRRRDGRAKRSRSGRIVQPTQEIRDTIEKANLIFLLSQAPLEDAPLANLRQILALLESAKP